MHANDMILVSVDDHLVEPPNLFEERLPGKFADAAPRVLGDHDVAVRSYDTGRFERSVGVSLGAFSAATNV